MKCLIIVNPYSGKRKALKILPKIISALNENNIVVEEFISTSIGSIDKSISLLNKEYDFLYVLGGDGTLNEVINALNKYKLNDKINIYYYPLGTMNDFASNFKLKVNIKKSLEIIKSNNIRKVNVIKANEKYIMYAGAFGKFTSVSYLLNTSLKKYFSFFTYYFYLIKSLFKKYDQEIELIKNNNCIKYKNYVTFFLNTSTLGGYKIHFKNDLKYNDNYFTLVIIKKNIFSLFTFLKFFLLGERFASKNLKFYKVNKLTLKSNKQINLNGDGELLLKEKEINLEVNKENYIKIYLPFKMNKYFK